MKDSEESIKFDGIQILRFLAASVVLVDHSVFFYQQKYPSEMSLSISDYFGWIGGWAVSVFFAISGFVILHSAQGVDWKDFAIRRLVRIYPAFWLAIALAIILKLAIFGSVPFEAQGLADLSTYLLIPSGVHDYPLGIEWSLVYEIFFYFVLASILAVAGLRYVCAVALGWLALIIGHSLLLNDYAERFPVAQYIVFSSRNMPFIAGIFVYRYYKSSILKDFHPYCLPVALSIALTAQLTSSSFLIMVLQTLSSALILYYFAYYSNIGNGFAKWLAKAGDMSYGIYLMHFTAITVILAIWSGTPFPALTLILLIFMAGGYALLFAYIEFHMHRFLARKISVLRKSEHPQGTVGVS